MTLPSSIVPRPRLELAHHRIHEGNHFVVHKINTNVSTPKYFLIIAPPAQETATIQTHMIFKVTSDLGLQIEFLEGATVSANGNELSEINSNRNSSTTTLVSVFEDPTVVTEGTIIFEERAGSGSSGGEAGEFDRSEEEIILKIGANYLLKVIPVYGAINITTEFNWYDARPSAPVPI